MTDEQLAHAFGALRTICTDIIGFEELATLGIGRIGEVSQVMYEAQVYAGGVELAHRVVGIAAALTERGGDR